MSNYVHHLQHGWVSVNDESDEDRNTREVRCSFCRGSGLVEVQGQETDCIECEGMGSVLVTLVRP